MKPILDFVLKKFIQVGTLRVTFSDGTIHTYKGTKPGLEAGLHLKTKKPNGLWSLIQDSLLVKNTWRASCVPKDARLKRSCRF